MEGGRRLVQNGGRGLDYLSFVGEGSCIGVFVVEKKGAKNVRVVRAVRWIDETVSHSRRSWKLVVVRSASRRRWRKAVGRSGAAQLDCSVW